MVLMSTLASINSSSFFSLDDPLSTRPLRITVSGYSDWVNSDLAWKLLRGQVSVDEPIKLVGYRGGQITDFLWSDLIYMVCISARIVEILRINKITGWATYPVEVFDRKGAFLPDYHGFAVTGGECRRDRSRSQVFTRQAVPQGKPFEVYKGLYFHEEDWDGSDLFWVRSCGGIVITEKVQKILKRAKTTNVRLIPLPEVELDVLLDQF
jgi:hypothetical protein